MPISPGISRARNWRRCATPAPISVSPARWWTRCWRAKAAGKVDRKTPRAQCVPPPPHGFALRGPPYPPPLRSGAEGPPCATRLLALNGLQKVAGHFGKTTALLTFALSARVSSSPQKTRREPMKTISRAVAVAAALGCANFACGIGARAQEYPTHPITMIVPFPAGGPTDTLGRVLSEGMRMSLGQPIIVENVTGAGSTIGVGRAAQAAPDGYTLTLGNWTSFVGAGALYRTSYDLLTDFEPISLLTFAPMLIVGKNALPANNAKELIAWLRANPDKASAASVGAGSAAHVCGLY